MKVITENEFNLILESNKTDLKIFIDEQVDEYKNYLKYLEDSTEHTLEFKVYEASFKFRELIHYIQEHIDSKFSNVKSSELSYFINNDNKIKVSIVELFQELRTLYLQEYKQFQISYEHFLEKILPLYT